eukprot:6198056-Pleurochrysis_carterae.AAC.2
MHPMSALPWVVDSVRARSGAALCIDVPSLFRSKHGRVDTETHLRMEARRNERNHGWAHVCTHASKIACTHTPIPYGIHVCLPTYVHEKSRANASMHACALANNHAHTHARKDVPVPRPRAVKDKAAEDFEKLKATGAPEYVVSSTR